MSVLWLCLLYAAALAHARRWGLPAAPFGADPDLDKNVSQIIVERGYPCENHAVVTQDGYVLNIQRINTQPGNNTGVVYLQHGLLDSSITWVIGSTNTSKCLAFVLADAGYDVWLGNSRGNVYAQSNIFLNPDSDAFWEFSYDEFIKYDIPAKLDYVKTTTNNNKLHYIGHSEGSNIGIATFSTNMTLAQNIDVFIALAPAVYTAHSLPPIIHDLFIQLSQNDISDIFGQKMFPTGFDMDLWHKYIPNVCQSNEEICADIMCLAFGCENNHNFNTSRFDVIMNHFPADTSVMNILHYIQMFKNNTFTFFDFGTAGNIQHYGVPVPPIYPIANLSVPTAIFYGSKDELADPIDVQHLLQVLPKSRVFFNQEIAEYGHMDFVWGLDAASKVYGTILELLRHN